jgi:HD-like signal output (HDOD) protein
MTEVSLRQEEYKLSRLSTLQLPTLPTGVPFLLKSLTNEDIEFIELATLMEKFPSIVGKLVSLANSAWSSPIAEVTSLEVTCSRLGLDVVKSTSIGLAIAAPFNPMRCSSFDAEYFWSSALLTADAASRLLAVSSANSDLESSTARTAGLLHNLALLWLVDKLPAEVDQAITMVKNNQIESLRQAFVHILGFDQQQAGRQLGSSWALPEPLVESMSHYADTCYQGPQRTIVTTVGLAAKLVSAVLKEEPCPTADTRLASLGITEEKLTRVFDQLNEQLVKVRTMASVLI